MDIQAIVSNCWLFVEHLNARIAHHLKDSPTTTQPFQTTLLAARKHLATLCANNSQACWPTFTFLAQLLNACRSLPPIDTATVNSLTEYLLTPANPVPHEQDFEDWTLRGQRPFLHEVPSPEELGEDIWITDAAPFPAFSTQKILSPSTQKIRNVSGYYWDEFLDPLSITQGFLGASHGLSTPEEANRLIQHWIRITCDIPFSTPLKHAFPLLANHLNDLFFNSERPSRASFHTARSSTLSISLIVDALHKRLSELLPATPFKHAVGFYLFLRFTRNLRMRYYWPSLHSPKRAFRSISSPAQCASALRSIDHAHLLNRSFGIISDITGLNFLFKGGILPRVNRGRTIVVTGPAGAGKTVLALQTASTVAKHGGLSVYISFEESYSLVLDRLAAFQFNNPKAFDVDHGSQIPKSIASKSGLLYLLTGGDVTGPTKELDLLAEIDNLGRLSDKNHVLRAVIVDSVNALSLNTESAFERRYALQLLVQAIERAGVIGVLLAEADSEVESILCFVSDTVIELGQEHIDRARWIEIKKCRTQDFHSGQHPLRLQLSRGVRIYPSLSAIRSSLRRRPRSTLSELRLIPLPASYDLLDSDVLRTLGTTFSQEPAATGEAARRRTSFIAEKSSILVYGRPNTGKTGFALNLMLSPPIDVRQGFRSRPSTILVVNFRTTERHFEQSIRSSYDLRSVWSSLKFRRVRWYSPGTNLSAAHIISDIRTAIRDCRKQGLHLERIVFDELENAERSLPRLREEPLFWSTLVDLVGTHAITSVFVFGLDSIVDLAPDSSRPISEGAHEAALVSLRMEADYVLKLQQSKQEERVELVLEKFPDFRFPSYELDFFADRATIQSAKPAGQAGRLTVQINGKKRGLLQVSEDMKEHDVFEQVVVEFGVRFPELATPERVVYVPGRIISITTRANA